MPVGLATSSDGRRVAEIDLTGGAADTAALVAEARASGATVVWAYGEPAAAAGFVPAGAYVCLAAAEAPRGDPLPATRDPAVLHRLFDDGYRGLWGHKLVLPERIEHAAGREELVHVVLDDCGVCRVDTVERLIDGPGVVPAARTPAAYVRLVLAAGAVLGPGPATIESWGDAPEVIAAYEALGYAVVERVPGFELAL